MLPPSMSVRVCVNCAYYHRYGCSKCGGCTHHGESSMPLYQREDLWVESDGSKLSRVEEENTKLKEEVERLQVQLAGCSVAALGAVKDIAKEGEYGWSPAYQDVLDLREEYDKLSSGGKQ